MTSSDLFLAGAGTLGTLVGKAWRARHPKSNILAETATAARHEELLRAGITPRRREEPSPSAFPNVLFCVPPSPATDYSAEIRRALGLWNGAGALLFTSSTSVYAEEHGAIVTERSTLAANPRARRLTDVEALVLQASGRVVRLAGLYGPGRGPHRVYGREVQSSRSPEGILNLIHFEDAASLCLLILEKGQPRTIYLGCDGQPFTRRDFGVIIGKGTDFFTGNSDEPLGRRCENHATREALSWSPRWKNFRMWFEQAGEKEKIV